MSHWGGLLLCLLLWLLPPSLVAAQTAQQTQAAQALFDQAKGLMETADYAEACEKFAASQALEPGLGTLLYLGDCYERAGRFASAISTFRTAAELARDRNDAARQHLASVRVSALEPRVPTLEVQRGPAPQAIDLQITVNGSPLAGSELNRARPRDAGSYEIRFSAPGYEAFVSRIELKNGGNGSATVTVPRLVPLLAARESASENVVTRTPSDPPGSTQRVLGWVVGSAGLALAATGGIFAGLAASANRDSKADCDPVSPNRCGPEGVRLRNDAKSLAGLATLTGVLGGLGIAGGLVLYVSAPSAEGSLPEAALIAIQGELL